MNRAQLIVSLLVVALVLVGAPLFAQGKSLAREQTPSTAANGSSTAHQPAPTATDNPQASVASSAGVDLSFLGDTQPVSEPVTACTTEIDPLGLACLAGCLTQPGCSCSGFGLFTTCCCDAS